MPRGEVAGNNTIFGTTTSTNILQYTILFRLLRTSRVQVAHIFLEVDK